MRRSTLVAKNIRFRLAVRVPAQICELSRKIEEFPALPFALLGRISTILSTLGSLLLRRSSLGISPVPYLLFD